MKVELNSEIQRNFVLGGRKAAAIGLVMKRATVNLVSEMEPDFVDPLFMKPHPTLQAAFDSALKKHGPNAVVHVMPVGGSTLPTFE